jgi:hypothetical protein
MKKIILLLGIGLFMTAISGFATERDPAPIEKTVFDDADYGHEFVVSSEIEFEASTVIADHADSFITYNNVGLASLFYFEFIRDDGYPYLDEWKFNRKHLSKTRHNHYTTHGGVILKISLT